MTSKELSKLIDRIDECDENYYNKHTSLVSDSEYDQLKVELSKEVDSFILSTKADEKIYYRAKEALTRIGVPPPDDGKWPKIIHEQPMNSLTKKNTPEKLLEWYKSCNTNGSILICEKMDGISLSLKYENGNFAQGVTRGDGEKGEDITGNIRRMKNVPKKIEGFTGYVRGEIVLKHSDIKYFPDIKNPRNSASGIAKRSDGKDCEHLSVVCYAMDGKNFETEKDLFDGLKNDGFETTWYVVVNSIEEVVKYWQQYMDEIRDKIDYDIDGLVIKINNLADQMALGELDNRPKGAVAFKFDAMIAETVLEDVVWQVGDTGRLTPVGILKPVFLAGVTISRASLHNASNVNSLGLFKGCKVLISRRNDVIPFIEKCLNVGDANGQFFAIPSTCPDCGASVSQYGEYLSCSNKKGCRAQIVGRLSKWVSELNILEWGDKILQKLVDSGMVKDVADLYRLKASDIASIDRMGEKSAKNLIAELDKFREIQLENFLGGLTIDNVATSTVKLVISAGHSTLDDFYKLSVNDLTKISGFGDIKAKALYQGLIDNKDRIADILSAGVKIKDKIKGNFSGKIFVFTGSSSIPRAKLAQMVQEHGGETKTSVVKGTHFLVIADPNSTSSKARAARKLGTTLISEEEFLDMLK